MSFGRARQPAAKYTKTTPQIKKRVWPTESPPTISFIVIIWHDVLIPEDLLCWVEGRGIESLKLGWPPTMPSHEYFEQEGGVVRCGLSLLQRRNKVQVCGYPMKCVRAAAQANSKRKQ